MHSYRVSKFDPGASIEERRGDWTSMSDVGKQFSGQTLSQAAYEGVESRYLHAVRLVLAEAHVRELRIQDVVRSSIATSDADWITEGAVVDTERAVAVCRAQLREQLSCHMVAESGFSLDVGFDLYLYITSPFRLERTLEEIRGLGLHVEPGVASPYFSR